MPSLLIVIPVIASFANVVFRQDDLYDFRCDVQQPIRSSRAPGPTPDQDLARRASIKPEDVRAIEAGAAPETAAKFADILALGASAGFHLNGPVVPGSGLVSRRAPSHVAGRRNEVQLGALLATDSQAVNCYNCHWHADQPPGQEGTPLAWGPDLALTRERLREQWTEDWLWSPGMIYPFTAMPGNFTGDPPQYQTVYPDSTNLEQVQAVLDWLYNFDRISEPAPN